MLQKIKTYQQFVTENTQEMVEIFHDADVLESIVTDSETLLQAINAEEVNLYREFNVSPLIKKIDDLYFQSDFNTSLEEKGLKKSDMDATQETETFIDKTLNIKFFLLYTESELKPDFIVFQSRRKGANEWDELKCYRVQNDINNFYNKLTSKTVEIKKGDKNYIYVTSNAGNDWILKNIEDENDEFRKMMNNDDIKAILTEDDISVTIIA
jgi:hypothetical protein